jgi:hypothetical protein
MSKKWVINSFALLGTTIGAEGQMSGMIEFGEMLEVVIVDICMWIEL